MSLAARHFSALLVVLTLTGCATVSLDYPKVASTAIDATEEARLARGSAAWRSDHPDRNGFYPLSKGLDAFGARLSLADAAEVSIDVQYFLMKPDDAGLVFAAKLLEAADRGVRIRLLLDDVFTTVSDAGLALLNNHENIEVRIFNPVSRKGVYVFNYVGNFKLANRRMHNKTFIADNQMAIVGGRNIAVEYFQLETSGEFMDFDMLSSGPIVKVVSQSFDDYWNDVLAVPLDALIDTSELADLENGVKEIQRLMAESGDSIYAAAINSDLMQKFYADTLPPYYADARLVVDEPQKLREEISNAHQIVARELKQEMNEAEHEVIIFTPYLIPGDDGVDFIRNLHDRGVKVIIVTNSLATNNHTAVHSAYMGYRKDIIQAGAELWEARADAAKITAPDGTTELDQLTLHTKGILIDRRTSFVGSLNLDPRSIDINTELGLLIDSPELTGDLAESSLREIPNIAYRLQLNDKGKIRWHATIDGREVVEKKEPQTSWWRRFSAWLQKIAPESQL